MEVVLDCNIINTVLITEHNGGGSPEQKINSIYCW